MKNEFCQKWYDFFRIIISQTCIAAKTNRKMKKSDFSRTVFEFMFCIMFS